MFELRIQVNNGLLETFTGSKVERIGVSFGQLLREKLQVFPPLLSGQIEVLRLLPQA